MALNLVRIPHPVTLEGMTTHRAEPGGTIADFVDGDCHAVLNGELITADEWAARTLRDGDVLALRARVAGDDTDPLRTILQVALVVASFAVAGSAFFAGLGAFAKGAVAATILVGGSLIINAIAPPRLPRLGRDSEAAEAVYSLIGGANRARLYAPQLLVFGSHRLFPDLGAKEYTTFERSARTGEAAVDFTLPGDRITPPFVLPILPVARAPPRPAARSTSTCTRCSTSGSATWPSPTCASATPC